MKCILTLEIPKAGKHSIAVAATCDRGILVQFKRTVLESYANAVRNAEGDSERLLRQSQYEHMQHVLDYLISETSNDQE